nr:putative ribonuclease H-like domain-containing protein [Tanacetum cinerariifolium]
MQGILGEIERRDPNPMTCTTDIAAYNKIRSENKLFQFLNALDRKYDPIKREILWWDPLPTAEAAYAAVRKETAHQNILGGTQQGVTSGVKLTDDLDGIGLVSKGRPSDQNFNSSSSRIDKTKLKCENCGMTKHTKEQCFEIVGYPDWWDIRTGKIIGRGTERQGLYYVDEVVTQQGTVMLAHGSTDREAWLWHRQLGHPSTREFVNTSIKEFCQKVQIIHQTSCAHTPEQNGVSERKNRFLLEINRALMIESHVPKYFLPEALTTGTYLVNRLPTRPLGLKTPLQVLSKFHKLPSTLTLKPHIFGCSVFVHIPKMKRSKIDPCAEKYVFVRYGINQHRYRCYSLSKRHIFTTMNCDFLETEYFYNTQHTGQGENEYNDVLSWLKLRSSSKETSHKSLPQSTDIGNSTTNDDLSILMSKVRNHQTQTQECVNSPTDSPTVYPTILPTLSDANIDCETYENNESPESSNNETEQRLSNNETEQHSSQVDQIKEEPVRYELPPRTNRGVLPKRYTPKKEARRSRYPMANIAKGNLSPEA